MVRMPSMVWNGSLRMIGVRIYPYAAGYESEDDV